MIHTALSKINSRQLLTIVGLLCLGACSQSTVSNGVQPSHQTIASTIPSSATKNTVGRFKQFPVTVSSDGSYTEAEGYVGGFMADGQITRTEEIEFSLDETEQIIGGGTVAAGTIHEYFFTAPAGQQLTIELQIEENHEAAFQLQDRIDNFWSNTLSPYPAIAARHWSGMLPKSDGQLFRIVVGPTNDSDASYLMLIAKESH